MPILHHRIERVQVIHPQDAGRLGALGLIASMQLVHATSDRLMAERIFGSLAAFSHAWRTQKDHGACQTFGSDAPVESSNPFLGLHAAVTIYHPDGSPDAKDWVPEQRLTVIAALDGYTSGPAFVAGMEDCLGCLSPGFLADLVVIDTDPFTCERVGLCAIRPVANAVGGDRV